ncbi:MAG TPA: hypothetical protein VEX62_08400 [Candidatus Limnocylindrales bacterium]|nr:hypothetical protein [Candidatus Limnocylindrales bacterium]
MATEAPDERERSDSFWGDVTDYGNYGLRFDSLEEVTDSADLVVVGRVVDLTEVVEYPPGPDDFVYRYTYGIVDVNEVIKGEAHLSLDGYIHVRELGFEDMDSTRLPHNQALLFLMEEEGLLGPPDDPDTLRPEYHYVRANPYQTAIRQVGGVVDIVDGPRGWVEVFGPFPSDLDGRKFDLLLESVRQIATRS